MRHATVRVEKMRVVERIPPKRRPVKVCPMCGRLFFQNHGLRIYCTECAEERDKECRRKWAREHPINVRRNHSDSRARHRGTEPVPTKGWIWELIFGYAEDETFERGVFDRTIFDEDIAFASWYAERHKYE